MKLKNKNPEYLLKMGFVAIGILVIIAIIIGSWVWNLIFDPTNFDVVAWGNSAIFNGSISLAMMVLGFVAVNESLKSKENGKYQKRIDAFNDLVSELFKSSRIVFFDQFISWYAEKQVREKKIKYLTRHGMPRIDAEIVIDYADVNDIPLLSGLEYGKKPSGQFGKDKIKKLKDGKEVLLPAFRDTLAPFVEEVLNGEINVIVEDASYYTTIDKNKDGNLTSLERAQATEKDRIKSMRYSFISKIVTGLIYITIFSLLAVDLNQGAGTSEAIWNLIMRIGSATLGFICGGFSGSSNTRFLYKWLGDKMRVINEYNQYLDSGEFRPRTYEETSQERITKIHQEEEETLKNIVEPDVMTSLEETERIKPTLTYKGGEINANKQSN